MREEQLVGDHATLAEISETLSRAPAIAVDTEFVRETTYFPQLCLLQVATRELIACVDCLAPLDLDPLFDALFRSDCDWIVHSARQDLEVLWTRIESRPARLYDTQVAAALLGFPPQIGLQELLSATLGIELEKGHARTDWSKRPISEAALRYAIDDVRYLQDAWAHLERRLVELGRLEWFHEEAERILQEPLVADAPTIFKRLRAVSSLGPEQQRAAYCLVEWREQRAMQADRPRRWILSDEQLVGIARAMPADLEALGAVEGLPRRLVSRSGKPILGALRETERADVVAGVEAAQRSQLPDKARLKQLQAEVRARAAELGIQPEVLATRRDLAAVAAGEPPATLASGWRARVLGPIGAGLV